MEVRPVLFFEEGPGYEAYTLYESIHSVLNFLRLGAAAYFFFSWIEVRERWRGINGVLGGFRA
jgi:hypothetical protein